MPAGHELIEQRAFVCARAFTVIPSTGRYARADTDAYTPTDTDAYTSTGEPRWLVQLRRRRRRRGVAYSVHHNACFFRVREKQLSE